MNNKPTYYDGSVAPVGFTNGGKQKGVTTVISAEARKVISGNPYEVDFSQFKK